MSKKEFFNLAKAARRFPGNPHLNSVRRWAGPGVYGVKLKTIRFAGKRLTCDEWCAEFQRAVMSATVPTDNGEATEAALDELGV